MRWHGLLWVAAGVAWVGAMVAVAQNNVDLGQAEEQIPPYPTHQDRRHGHDHLYPDRGAIVRDLPRGTTVVNYAGISYRFAGGVWYEPRGPAYIVVAPPIGLVVPALPGFATDVHSRGKNYLYADDTYYRARPDLGGYEVVNDPADLPPILSRPAEHSSSRSSEAEFATEAAMPPSERPKVPPHTEMAPHPVMTAPAEPQGHAEQSPGEPARPAKIEPPAPAPLGSRSSSPQSAPSNATRVSVLPQNGQSADEQARDRYVCYRFAVAQSGFDPLGAQTDATPADTAQRQADYERAQTACLEERGYRLR